MSKGHPDYFGLPYFPKYGTLSEVGPSVGNLAIGATDYIYTIEGKGRLWGGFLRIGAIVEFQLVNFYWSVNGIDWTAINLENLLDINIISQYMNPFYLQGLQYHGGKAELGFGYDLSFEDGFRLKIFNNTSGVITFTGFLLYHEILG